MKTSVILLFGSFNPIHKGHISIAGNALDELKADEVWFVVSPQNPFKEASTLAPESDRLAMVNIAIKSACDADRMKACDVEFSMPRPSRTVDTLNFLADTFPDHKFTLLIGSDNVKDFPKWKNYEEILDKYTVAVYPREGYTAIRSDISSRFLYLKDVPLSPGVSSAIREGFAGGDIDFCALPPGVDEYIMEHGLYGTDKEGTGIEFLNKLIEKNHMNPCNYNLRGKMFFKLGMFDKAMNDFIQATELDGEYKEAREYIALLREIFNFRYADIYNP